ncbi:MAG: Scavenger receptor cysteine-rich domain [Phormidium sp. OSCR]|nr:MAG: Scavenger receptor cysteine-rich domain [Phormidium sp. OSCR]
MLNILSWINWVWTGGDRPVMKSILSLNQSLNSSMTRRILRRRRFRRPDKLWRAIAAVILGLSLVLVPQLTAAEDFGLARESGLGTFQFLDHEAEINRLRWFDFDAVWILGSIAAVGWLISLSVYSSTQDKLKQPTQIAPRGESRIQASVDHGRYFQVFAKAGIVGFFLSLGVFLPLVLLNVNIAVVAIAISLGLGIIQAIRTSISVVISAKAKSIEQQGVSPSQALLNGIFTLVVYSIIPFIFIWLVLFPSFSLIRMWGNGINLVLFFSVVASSVNGWWTAVLAESWIEKNRNFICNTCGTELVSVADSRLHDRLNEAQRVAKDLSSTQFKGWNCPSCTGHGSDFHLQSCVINPWMFDNCPNCQEFTVTKTLSTLGPSLSSNRKIQQTTYNCQICGYSKEEHSINS